MVLAENELEISAEVVEVMPVGKSEFGYADVKFIIRPKGKFDNVAVVEVRTFFHDDEKTVKEVCERAISEARRFSALVSRCEQFVDE